MVNGSKDAGNSTSRTIDISTLSAQELNTLRTQLDNELTNYVQSSIALQRAAGDFHASGRAIEELGQREKGQVMLLPLTSSVYIRGELEAVDKVVVDVGTGYYVEKSTESGVDYCKRKVLFLQKQLEALSEIIRGRREALRQVTFTLQQKVASGTSE